MGQLTSYCKRCNHVIHWFLKPKYGFITCKLCGEPNGFEDLLESANDKNHWKVLQRNKKIKKILNENGTNN